MIVATVALVLPAIRLCQIPLPRMPASAIQLMDFHIDGDFSRVVQQCRADYRDRPCAGLSGLFFCTRFRWQQITLAQPDGVAGNFQRMIQQPAGSGMVMTL